MLKSFSLIVFSVFFFGKNYAQNIQGILLKASSREPITHGSIEIENSGETFFTRRDGFFSLTVQEFPVSLQISAPGFKMESIVVKKPGDDLVVYLFPKGEILSEVVLRSFIISESLQQTPAAVNVLTPEILKRYDETNLMQSFQLVPGVDVHQGALNTNKISIRGIGARSQYSTNRLKAYFEGIPISTGEGETTLDDFDREVVERVEIIKGPASSVYGAGLGGVVNLYAARAQKEEIKATVKNSFGSFGLWKKTIKASQASKTSNFFAAYNHLKSDGFRDNGEYDRRSITLHGKLTGDASNKLSVLANVIRLMAYIPSSVNREQVENDPSSAAFTWNASRGYESYDKGMLGLSNEYMFSENFNNTTSIFMNFRDAFEPRPFDILKEEQVAIGARTKFNFKTRLVGLASKFSIGAEIFREWYDTATFENLYEDFPGEGSVLGNGLSNNSQDRKYTNFFGQWNLSFSEKFKIEAGLNANSTNYNLTDLFYKDEIDRTGDYQFKTIFSPRVGAIYNLTPLKTLYASLSHGFSTPEVSETLTPEGLINTNLQPETGMNYEIGLKGNWLKNQLYTEISLFSIQVENLIVAERVGEDQYIGRNVGKTNHNGVEFLFHSNFILRTGITAKPYMNASFNFYEFEEFTDKGNDFSGNNLPAVPNKTIAAGVDFISDKGYALYAHYQYVGKMPLNDANTHYNESYKLFNLKASYSLDFFRNFEAEIYAGINNLFEEKYASGILPNAVGFGGASPRYFYPGNPRNYFGGIGLSYMF